MPTSLLSVLPEVILTIVGVIIMLAEPVIAAGRSRKPLGWLAVLGTLAAGSRRSISTACSASFSGAPSAPSMAPCRSTTSPSSSTC